LKIVSVNTSDSGGGAAIAARRLHAGMCAAGADCELWVQTRRTQDRGISGGQGWLHELYAQARLLLDQLPVLRSLRFREGQFSPAWLPGTLASRIAAANPDVVHLHWIAKGWMKIEDIGEWNAPTVWTLHDMWPFTGGCHYDAGCERWRQQCGSCPTLRSAATNDVSRWVHVRKQRRYRASKLHVVCPSRWLADCVRGSSAMSHCDVSVIPNGLDLNLFRPRNRLASRQRLGIPPATRLIAFGAMNSTDDHRKGFRHLVQALASLDGTSGDVRLLIYGGRVDPGSIGNLTVHNVGHVADETRMVDILNAADVFVAPSEQDNLPNTVVEALACGCPVVAFDIGGMPDLVVPGRTGMLAKPFDAAHLAECIQHVLGDQVSEGGMRANAREHAEAHYGLDIITARYLALYNTLVDDWR
jgi:glycosyltransferase involved in cell wall biosynthesis